MSDRYREEDGRRCIDIRLRRLSQLFDTRDPAPFRERDLDARAVEYILGATEEIPQKEPLKIVVLVTEEPVPQPDPHAIGEAVHEHFRFERAQIDRRFRRHVRRAQASLGVGLLVLSVFLTLSGLTGALPLGMGQDVLREGFRITGWVAMWRPLEALLYDWWPLIDERRQMDRILASPVSVRYEFTSKGEHENPTT